MATILFANDATTTLAGPLTQTATTANVAAGTGVLFPQPGSGQLFKLTLTDAATGLLKEIAHVTAVNGDSFTIVRGQENTSPQSWLAGDLADNLLTAGTASAFAQTLSITSGAFQGTDTGTSSNTMVVGSTTPSISAPVQGQYFEIVKSGQGNTGPVTLAVSSGGSAVSVVYKDGTALGPGDYPANAAALLYYTGGVFQFMACQSAPAVKVYSALDTGTSDAIALNPVPPVPALTDNVELHFIKGTSPNTTATPTIAVSGLPPFTVVRRDNTPVAPGDLPANSYIPVKYDAKNGVGRLTWVAAPTQVQQAVSTPQQYNVSPGSGNDNNPGTTAMPFATIAGALAASSRINFSTTTLTIKLLDTGATQYPMPAIVPVLPGQIVILGDVNNKSGYTVVPAAGAPVITQSSAQSLTFRGLTAQMANGGGGFVALNGSVSVDHVDFTCPNGTYTECLQANPGGTVNALDGCSVSGTGQAFVYAAGNFSAGNLPGAPTVTITMVNSPTFQIATLYVPDRGSVNLLPTLAFSGTASGAQWNVGSFAVLGTGGRTGNFVPGQSTQNVVAAAPTAGKVA